MLTPNRCRYPSNTRNEVRRRFYIPHLPQLGHHRRSWCTRGSARRCDGRDPSIRSKRCLSRVDSADRRFLILLHHRSDLQRVVGLELCLQFHEQCHVCGPLCLYARNFRNQRPRYWQRLYCDCKQSVWDNGSHHSYLRQLGDKCTCLRVRSAVHRLWDAHSPTTFRAEGKGEPMNRRRKC